MRVSAAETTRVGRAEPAKTTVAGRMASPEVKAAVGSTVMILFIIALISPIYFNIGTLRLNLHRVILLIAFVPLFFQLVSGKAGGVRAADVFFFLYSAWIGVALFVVHGTIQIPFIGITIVEILGGYMLRAGLHPQPSRLPALLQVFRLGAALPAALRALRADDAPAASQRDPRLGFRSHPLH